jgi:hypothetical protein
LRSSKAGIAILALRNWKRQEKAKREAEFLDALIEAVHTYISEMPAPVTLVHLAKIGMESHAPTWEGGDHAIKGAIAYIQKNGKDHSKRLQEALKALQPSIIRLRSLAAKGQMFKFNGYVKCQNAITMLTWQHDRMESLMVMLGSTSLNWDHPEVIGSLKKVMTIDADDIRKHMGDNNVAILEFAIGTYKRIYG